MNNNYPNYILKKIRQYHDLEENDTSRDEEFQNLDPEEAFDYVLQYTGIIGYKYTILRWIEEIFKVKLSVGGNKQSRQDFVQGLGNIFRAQDRDDEVVAMRMDENNTVIVYFADGTHRTSNLGDKVCIVSDRNKELF